MIMRDEHIYVVSETISLTSKSTKLSFPNNVNPTVACKMTIVLTSLSSFQKITSFEQCIEIFE